MKTWKTIALSVITTSALATGGALTYSYLQPSHYEGDTFTNVSTTTSSTSVSSSDTSTSTNDSDTNTNPVYTESNSSEQLEQKGGTCMGQTSGDRAYQPTFKVECVSPKNDLYTVIHIPSGDKCKPISYEQAESFCKYMEQIAYGKTSLSYSMDENLNTYLTNNNN